MCRDVLDGIGTPLAQASTHTYQRPSAERNSPDLTLSRPLLLSNEASGTAPLRPVHHLTLSLLRDRRRGWSTPVSCCSLSAHRFVMLSLEFDYMCQYDYVEVRDGDSSSSQIIKRFCGNERPAPIRSTDSSLHILFHSDGSKNFDGFHAIFEEITGKGHGDRCSIVRLCSWKMFPFCSPLLLPAQPD